MGLALPYDPFFNRLQRYQKKPLEISCFVPDNGDIGDCYRMVGSSALSGRFRYVAVSKNPKCL